MPTAPPPTLAAAPRPEAVPIPAAPAPPPMIAPAPGLPPATAPPSVFTAPPPPARPASLAVQRLDRMPLTFRQSLPGLKLEVLVYSERQGEGLVFINGRKYTEGQSVEGTITLEAITPEGVILNYEGTRFLLAP
jgi:general secretion pathway protein B